MDTFSNATQAARRPGGKDGETGPAGSGEGARSALEQLIRQEQRRAAQRLRDAGEGPATPQPAP